MDNYDLYVEGACLSTLRETETGVDVVRVNRAGLNYHVDTHLLPDQGTDPILLKSNLSFRMQGITTSRILALRSGWGRVWVGGATEEHWMDGGQKFQLVIFLMFLMERDLTIELRRHQEKFFHSDFVAF